ncbi:MAG: thiamine phosphate synthase [Chloroflexi bacterium]|nr:thiamine phosphate synthase [Chloroflexota bacterium]
MCRNRHQCEADPVRPDLPNPCLCLVTDRRICDEATLVARIADAVSGGVDLVQLREKDLPGGPLLELAQRIREAISDSAMLIINERVDVAAAIAANGVQLGEEALPTIEARKILGHDTLIGRSVHSLEGALQAAEQGADFLLVGTMFASRSHPGEEPAGPALVRQITVRCSLPLFGIGGIDASNAGHVMDAGASGVAVITSILASPSPKEAARQIKRAIVASSLAARAS